jgi:hypothetical protein
MADDLELQWAAGLLDGQGGTIQYTLSRGYTRGCPRRYPYLTLTKSERDVLDRFRRAVGGRGSVHARKGHKRKDGSTYQLYVWTASTKKAREVAALLLPHVCERNKERLAEAFAEGKETCFV